MNNGFSIIIPSWNNLQYLKYCIESIYKNSAYKHEIIVHINEGTDNTLEYIKNQKIKYTYSNVNLGICKSINLASELCTKEWLLYANDDFYFLPEWDLEIIKFYNNNKERLLNNCILCGTMIEYCGNNNCCIIKNYGHDIQNFKEKEIIKDIQLLKTLKCNVKGSTWPPTLYPVNLFKQVGGMSEEYTESYGFGSDPDIVKKIYDIGIRNIIGIGSSLVYHFGSKTTSRIKNNGLGKVIFQKKYNMTIDYFVNNILQRGQPFI